MIILVSVLMMISDITQIQSSGQVKIVYYLHGKIVEDMGLDAYNEQYGKYEYLNIIEALKSDNVKLINELRPKGTDVKEYAGKLADEIKHKLESGVNAEEITIIGASKGALIAMQTSTLLKNRDMNFVFIAGNIRSIENYYKFDLHGNILGFWESSDPIAARSYANLIEASTGVNHFKEYKLDTNLGHGIVFKPLEEWVLPTKDWIQGIR